MYNHAEEQLVNLLYAVFARLRIILGLSITNQVELETEGSLEDRKIDIINWRHLVWHDPEYM